MIDILYAPNAYRHQVQVRRYGVTHKIEDKPVKVGRFPREGLLTGFTVHVQKAFTGAKLKFGTTEEVNDLGEADVGTVGKKVVDLSTKGCLVPQYEETIIYAKLDKKVASGEAIILVEYI